VIWAPGNHELWTPPSDPVQLRGAERYQGLVDRCRDAGVLTPEDPFPVWHGPGGPVTIVPLFTLYDYSWRAPGTTVEAALADAHAATVVFTDEFLLHPDPHVSRAEWCRHRIAVTAERLDRLAPDTRTVLVSHWPLHRGPTRMLRRSQMALWCGTDLTQDWHLRYRAAAVVYGHLHIPLTLEFDGVRFEEVSLGYPREWRRRGDGRPVPLRRILPADPRRHPQNDLLEAVATRRAAFHPSLRA
ncbi:MAG: metallophosphoesterase, partial [Chloroflexota bacterium]|nr:metallophosphoesterase [Chloroflexota bacterium]